MPTEITDPLELYERNDMTLAVTVTDANTGDPVDISAGTGRTLEMIIKGHADDLDTDGTTLSTATGEITVTDGPNGKADVAVSSALLSPHGVRFVRLDVIDSSSNRKTAWYKYEAEIVNL